MNELYNVDSSLQQTYISCCVACNITGLGITHTHTQSCRLFGDSDDLYHSLSAVDLKYTRQCRSQVAGCCSFCEGVV